MKTFTLTLGIVTGLLLLSQTLCGFWIRSHNLTDAGALGFHMKLGTISVLFALISVALLIVLARKTI